MRWVAEDWEELTRLIAADGTIAEREAILGLLRTIGNPDRREAELRRRFPKQYRDIRERLYPLLRAVNFKYDLRRVGMVKDTIHTTVPDTLYARGVKLLNEREYNEALRILRPYEDRNTAVAMLSLGHDEQAYEVLCRLEEEADGRIPESRGLLPAWGASRRARRHSVGRASCNPTSNTGATSTQKYANL